MKYFDSNSLSCIICQRQVSTGDIFRANISSFKGIIMAKRKYESPSMCNIKTKFLRSDDMFLFIMNSFRTPQNRQFECAYCYKT